MTDAATRRRCSALGRCIAAQLLVRRAMVEVLQAEKMIAHVIFGILLFFEGLSKREHCHHKILYVEDITQHTATLHWKISHSKGVVEDYKVLCAGVRQYITVEGDREVDLDTVMQFVPQGVGQVFLSKLQANFNYSCVVQAESEKSNALETRSLLFSTLYSVPEAPKPPVIAYGNHGKQIDIQLFPTSTKYGPIDGYEVHFHILDKDPVHVHGQPALPRELSQPRGLLASMEAAHSSLHPIPFYIAFRNGSLPSHITVSDSLLQGAIRSGTTYYVITVAYTDNYEEELMNLLHGNKFSPWEDFFVNPFGSDVINPNQLSSDKLHSEFTSQRALPWVESQLIKLSMVVGVVSSNLILLYFLMVGCCILRMETQRSPGRLLPETQYVTVQQGVMSRNTEMRAEEGDKSQSSADRVNHMNTTEYPTIMRRDSVETAEDGVESPVDHMARTSTSAGVNSDETHNRPFSGSIGHYSVRQPSSSSVPQHCSTGALSSTPHYSTLPSSALAMASSHSSSTSPPVETLGKEQPNVSATDLEGGSTEQKLGRDVTSTPSAEEKECSSPVLPSDAQLAADVPIELNTNLEPSTQTSREFVAAREDESDATFTVKTAVHVETELTQELLITEEEPWMATADPEGNGLCVYKSPEQSSVSCSLGKSVPAFEDFEVHVHDTSSKTNAKEELRASHENVSAQLCYEEPALLPVTQLGISGILKKAMHSTESLQSSVHSGWSSTSKDASRARARASGATCVSDDKSISTVRSDQLSSAEPGSDCMQKSATQCASLNDLHSAYVGGDFSQQVGMQSATQQVEHRVSSLMFVPRGMSRGPHPLPSALGLQPSSPPHTGHEDSLSTADLAPDLEMDLYGISYSLDDSLDN